jgi:two-component system response regulator TtrR
MDLNVTKSVEEPTEQPLSILCVDDEENILKALKRVFRREPFQILTASSGREGLAILQTTANIGLILSDQRMPEMSGLELQEKLDALGSQLPVIFVTGHGDVPMAVSALQRGACDFIEKPFHNEDLLSRIQRALELDNQLSARRQRDGVISHRLDQLTQREREVMQLVVAGKLNKQIADELNISMKTVEAHRARVMEKMGVRTLAELVKAVMMVN